jgi:hypothetical protein
MTSALANRKMPAIPDNLKAHHDTTSFLNENMAHTNEEDRSVLAIRSQCLLRFKRRHQSQPI